MRRNALSPHRSAGRSREVTLRRSDSEMPCSRMRVRSFSAKGDPPSTRAETTRRPRWRKRVGRYADEGGLPCPVDAFDGDEAVGGVGRRVVARSEMSVVIGSGSARWRVVGCLRGLEAGRSRSGRLPATRTFETSSSSIALGPGPELPPALPVAHQGRRAGLRSYTLARRSRSVEPPTASGDARMYVSGGCPPGPRRLLRRSRRRPRTAYDLAHLLLRGM